MLRIKQDEYGKRLCQLQKSHLTFFLLVYASAQPPPSLQQDICFVKVGVQRNWKQLVLSVTYSICTEGGVWQLFIFILHLCILELPTKHPREKFLDPQSTHEKKFWTHEIPTRKNVGPTEYSQEKMLDPRNTNEKIFRIHECTMAQWYECHETHRIGTLNFFLIVHVLKKFD